MYQYYELICISRSTLSHSIHFVWKVNTDITTRKLSKYNLHARQHNFNAFSFICVMFMFLSFKERHKNISLEWLLPVAVVDWGNTLLALKKANLTSNAKPRKCLIAVTKRLLRCVSGVKKKMRKDVFCY